MRKKHILLTNDDGFNAVGLKALIEALEPLAKLTVVAPAKNKSACGHSLTLDKPLKIDKIKESFYKVDDGTPSDCVYLSINNLFDEDDKPDLLVSGINMGANMGEDITYSGTVAAAMEGVLQGIPSIAISQVYKDVKTCGFIEKNTDFSLAQKTIATLVKKIFDDEFPLDKRKLLNVNIPQINQEDCKGMKITKAGHRKYGNDTDKHFNPRGEEYYWIGLHPLGWESDDKSCDFEAINDDFISISPIMLDLTSYDDIENLNNWIKK